MFSSLVTTVVTPSKWLTPRCSPSSVSVRPLTWTVVPKPGRVDLVERRGEEQIGAGLGRERGVAVLVARVGGQVAGRVELRGVDEERHDDHVARGARVADEAQMALVQRAHRRHEADDALGAPRGAQLGAHVGDRPHRPHAAATARVASARTS